eukprot:8461188-Lingulodinium_polyedra.AAC.1
MSEPSMASPRASPCTHRAGMKPNEPSERLSILYRGRAPSREAGSIKALRCSMRRAARPCAGCAVAPRAG